MGFSWGFSMGTLMKRLCKSLLKKRLGDLILGDIDLDQFDVQLTKGTLLLSDLALDADFINHKLSGSAIMVKEGSIKSLLVRFPLPLKSCEIVVEELELVLAPSVASEVPPTDTDCSVSGSNSQKQTVVENQRNDVHGNHCSTSTSRDVDEGVKRIANAVKWFLTSFNIRIKDVYVVFDPRTISDDKISEFNQYLVFRIKETEFGTHLSTNGLIKLNNFIKFQEAVIEFLKMDDVDALPSSDVETCTTEISPGHSTTTVLTGPIGGFSGTLNLSIPWSNGSLNLEKIDADVSVDSLELRVQTSNIQWIIFVWDSLKNKTVAEQNHVRNTADMSTTTSRFDSSSSTSISSKSGSDSMIVNRENLSRSIFTRSRQDKVQDSFLTRAHVIQDWVPELIEQEDQADPDSDCNESIEQFFECFEELRNSQMNLGNSGIWDWTCSVFNAITFASTLASGSDQVPREQPTEKTLRASIAEICVVLSFSNESDPGHSNVAVNLPDDRRSSELFVSCLSSAHFEPSNMAHATAASLNMHHLEARCQNVRLDLETYSQNLRFKASIGIMKLDEYYSTGSHDSEHVYDHSPFLSNHLREEIRGALPTLSFAARDRKAETTGRCYGNSNGLTKVELLQTFDECECHYDVSSTDRDGKSMTTTSVSVRLPPLIYWLHFHTIYMLLDFISKVEFSTKRTRIEDIESDVLRGGHKNSAHGDEKSSKSTSRTAVSPSASLNGQIAFSPARIIICFPSESAGDLSHPSFLDKFIVIDHSSSLNLGETSSPLLQERSREAYLGTPSTSIHLAMRNLDIYMVKSMKNGTLDSRFCKLSRQTFSALKILSVSSRSIDSDSGITMIWRKRPVTDPEMANKAWSLSKLHDQRITKKERNKGAGFSSSTTSQDLEQSSSSIRQELLQSTEFLLHVRLPCVSVHLSKKDCELLNQLLNHVLDGLSNGAASSCDNAMEGESTPSNDIALQTSVFFECSVLDVWTELDEVVEVGPLLQTELEGSWNCLKLSIVKFKLFSVSNIGGVNNASFLWVNHGEGELWGSIISKNEKSCEVCKDFLLVVCKDSASRRGDGEGTNVLSFGTAGCSVTHMWNPKLRENYTSVDVHSGTVVVPGGRLDWINAICLMFSSGSQESEQLENDGTTKNSRAGESSKSSFFLELVDVAVSYEPHFKNPTVNGEAPDLGPKYVACLLAASSFKLSNKAASDSTTTDFNIQLQDLGFLISESAGSKNVTCGYNVHYLRQTGYVKVARNTFIEAVLRMNSSFWKLEISESQFDVGTCHDTTYGLIRLSSQLQQLYAPDMRGALTHLQSRWNSVQQTSKQHISTDALDKSESSSEKLGVAEDCKSDGLLDDIIENAFYIDEDYTTSNLWDPNSHPSVGSFEMEDGFELNMATPEASDVNVAHIPLGTSLINFEADVTQIPLKQNPCPQQIVDSYYIPELLHSSFSSNEDYHCKGDDDACKVMESGDGGWYNDVSLMIVENHVSRMNSPQGEERPQQEGKSGVCSLDPDESCNLKGKIFIQDIDVKWRMYAGDDWSKPSKDTTCSLSSNGRDGNSSLEFTVSGLNVQFDMYPDGEVSVSKLSVCAQDINLCDKSRDAPWKMVLGCYKSKDYPRESCSSTFRLELESVRPEPLAPLEDYRLHLEFLPLRLHLDQGQLNFLINFFRTDSRNDNPHLPHENEIVRVDSASSGSQTIVEEALLPFFQKFDVRPLVLRIDYIPRQFDPIALSKGNYAELLNIVPWKGIDLKLKHVSAMGVYGWNSICETVAGEWLEDISQNQVHKLLKGLPPIRSLVAVSSGTKKLVSLPIKSYKKDRKLLKGIQRGAVAFIRSVSIEAVGLGVHLAAGAHDILLKTERVLTAVPPPLPSSEVKRTKENIRSNQPESAQQGIKQAYESLTDGLGRSASALIGTPLKVYNRGAGAGPALATAICAAPAAAIAPVSASARAVHYALLGLRNSLDPEHKRESMDKYLGPSQL